MNRPPRQSSRLLCLATLLSLLVSGVAFAVDMDRDGLLDVNETSRFDPTETDTLLLAGLGIEDLDGVSELHSDLLRLNLGGNRITEIGPHDLTGLSTQYLFFYDNQIETISPGAFAGLRLRDLNLNNNFFSDLHLEGGIYETLFHLGIDRHDVKRLFLDDAQVSEFSYDEIVRETTEIVELSMVGMEFLGAPPASLESILSQSELQTVTVDTELFAAYEDDFEVFASKTGNLLTVIEDVFADCNRTGAHDFDDLSCVTTAMERDSVLDTLSLRLGDLNGDGLVVFADFQLLSERFGFRGQSYLNGNLDLDELVDFEDFRLLSENFSDVSSLPLAAAAAVPEPRDTQFCWILLLLVSGRRFGSLIRFSRR